MKSIILSFLMFIVVFTALKFNVLRIFDHHIIVYVSWTAFVIVIFCALYLIGAPKWKDVANTFKKNPEGKNDEQK